LLESTFQTIQQLLMVLSWGIDLAAIADGTEGGGPGFAEDLETLTDLVADARGLAWDLNSLSAQLHSLLSLEAAPDTSAGLQAHSARMRQILVESYGYALRVQTLITTTIRTVKHILRVTEKIAEVLGGVSGHQNGQEYLAKLTQLQAQQHVTTAAFERAQAVQHLSDPVVLESLERIKANVRSDMPR
jgi:hypothetical protein